jgi:hypothetical protein
VIKERWGVDLKISRIYEILDNLNLSHQKAHRDCVAVEPQRYDNVDPAKQKKVEKRLKNFFETQRLQTPIQISNTIKHIYNLIL